MPFKIATWNVNSLRVRLPHLLDWLTQASPDVVALQETKIEDKHFLFPEIQQAGYQVVYSGQKTYNGVALLSRMAITDSMTDIPTFEDPQRRILAATINNVRVINLYVPNGSSVGSEKYLYKLNWLENITTYIQQQLMQYPQLIVLGDFNIAPDDRDLHDPVTWKDCVLISEAERAALQKLLSLGLQDSFRLFNQEAGHYSWWDYRMGAFRRNQGWRIDHLLLSQALAEKCTACVIDKLPRGWERPSDHTPVIATFDF